MFRSDIFLCCSTLFLRVSVGLLLVHVVVAQIHVGSTLSVEEKNSWVSSNGDFAVGFFNHFDQPNRYSVGIRFNSKSIPESKQTVVWIAGADVTAGTNSYFQLSHTGELILVDSLNGLTVWTSKTSQLGVVSALIRDDGNLVLLNGTRNVVWQSFDNPSDTLLPGQFLPVGRTLRAASRNSVSSYYSLYMNASGELQLRWESSVTFWTSKSFSVSNLSVVLTSHGSLQLVDQNLTSLWSVYGEDHNDSVNFRLLRLDVDGNLRIYSWVEASQSWRSVWQAVENQCNVFATCGQHGICAFNASGNAECKCPFRVTSNPNSKCVAQDCESGSTMVTHEHTSLYGVYPPTDIVIRASLEHCKNLCMRESVCRAVTFRNDGIPQCQIKRTQFLSGYSDPSLSSVSFVKKCADPVAVNPNLAMLPKSSSPMQSPLKRSYRLCIPCLLGAASGTIAIIISIQLGIGYYIYQRRNSIQQKIALVHMGCNSKGLMILSFTEIKDITGDFKHQIGPKMYRGILPNHQPVAIKDLEATIGERKFRASVSKIGNIHHKNLVKLQGFCCELNHRFLVYEYVKNGSVEKYLADDELSKRMTWERRIKMCLSVARAMCYLHSGCREFFCHGNLKWENVVLDKNLEAKVTEFGLDMDHSRGSYGGEKDVEDFGRMLLTLVTGYREVDDICDWTYKEWMQGQPESVVDKRIDDNVDLDELERVLRISFWCLQADERLRPPMGEIVKVLEGTLTVDPPCWRISTEEEEEPSCSGSEAVPTEILSYKKRDCRIRCRPEMSGMKFPKHLVLFLRLMATA